MLMCIAFKISFTKIVSHGLFFNCWKFNQSGFIKIKIASGVTWIWKLICQLWMIIKDPKISNDYSNQGHFDTFKRIHISWSPFISKPAFIMNFTWHNLGVLLANFQANLSLKYPQIALGNNLFVVLISIDDILMYMIFTCCT